MTPKEWADLECKKCTHREPGCAIDCGARTAGLYGFKAGLEEAKK